MRKEFKVTLWEVSGDINYDKLETLEKWKSI